MDFLPGRLRCFLSGEGLSKVKVGDIVKFSESHYKDSPGHEYVKDWIGIVIETKTVDFDEMKILWTIDGNSHISGYGELWFDGLDYEPFEVISESR